MIPPQNLYRVLTYAWDWLDDDLLAGVNSGEVDTVQNMIGHVLLNASKLLLRRGLDRAYVVHEDELSVPRGKFDVSTTMKRALERNGGGHRRHQLCRRI